MIRTNLVKEKLRRGSAVIGAFCDLPSPAVVEVAGPVGLDFIIVDAEHGPQDIETVEHMIRAAETSGVTPLVRVGLNLQQHILRYLDAGAMGVQIPMVNTRAEAEAVVNSVKYPPAGRRGLASVRAAGWGLPQPLGEYVGIANRETLVSAQLEATEALSNADAILSVEGVDVVFLGPTDLSASMGFPGQPTHPEVMEAIERVGNKIQAAGKVAGTIARDPDSYERWRRLGFQLLCTGMVNLLASAVRGYVEGCREQEEVLVER